jgi:hypothetical protein
MLYYEALPPFGRRFYHLESRSWGYLDYSLFLINASTLFGRALLRAM